MQPQTKRAIRHGVLILAVAGLSLYCNEGESPVSFTPDLPNPSNLSGSSSSSPSNPGVQPPSPEYPTGFAPGRFFGYTGNSIRTEARNRSGGVKDLFLACYCDPTGEIEDQELLDGWYSVSVGDNKLGKLKHDLGNFHWQCDAFTNRNGPRKVPYYQVNELVAFRTSRQMGLDLPTTCPTPDPPPPPPGCQGEECEPPPPPSCEPPNVEIDGVCLPVCDDGPQVNLRTLASTYDECHPFCTVNPEHPFCQPPCEPEGEPECQEQTWDTNTCSWVGECPPPVCEPDSPPPSDACTWDTEECEWDCPPPPEECELPNEGIIDGITTGSADTECGSIGYDGNGKDETFPWDLSGDFFLVKCGTQYEVQHELPTGGHCEFIENDVGRKKEISHISACVCEEDD